MSKLNYLGLTLKRSNRRAGVTISLLAAFIVVSRFLYVPFLGDNDIKGDFLEYKWLSSFLYSVGVEFSYLSFALILHYATNFMENSAARYFNRLACVISFVGFFFTSWILFESDKTNPLKEMFFSFIVAAVAIWVIWFVSKFIRSTTYIYVGLISSLKSKIRYVVDKMVIDAPSHVKDQSLWEEEIVEPTLDKLNE